MATRWIPPSLADPAVVAEVLGQQPVVARRLSAGEQLGLPLPSGSWPAVELLIGSLDVVAYRLLFLAKLCLGVTRERALAEAPAVDPSEFDRAARVLIVCGLATLEGERLCLTPTVSSLLELPHPLFSEHAEDYTTDVLARACLTLGRPAGGRKPERVAAIAAVLDDPTAVRAVLDSLPEASQLIFASLLTATLDGSVGYASMPGGISTYDLLPEALQVTQRRYHRAGAGDSALDRLCDTLLVGSNWSRTELWIWAETLVAVTGSLFEDWELLAAPAPVPLPTRPPRAAAVVAALRDVVRQVGVNPPIGKQSGGREPPVKFWRSAAKAAGMGPDLAVLLGAVAIELGLIVPVALPPKGRGRAAVHDCRWEPQPQRVAAFDQADVVDAWAALLEAWLHPQVQNEPLLYAARLLVLSQLLRVPEGHGVAVAELGPWAEQQHRLLTASLVEDVLGQLVAVGVADGDPNGTGIVGLSAAGRAVCESLDRVAAVLGAGSSSFVVQPDHSIIAPPDLNPAVADRLARIAVLESEGGAAVWRLAAAKLAREGHRHGLEALLGFLREHSSVGVPAVIERFVSDCAASASPLTVAAVGCVVTGADPVTVAEAARHKAAKLTVVAPGVAVSPLPEAKVIEILLGKGVVLSAPSVEVGTGGATGRSGADGSRPTGPAQQLMSAWDAPHRSPEDPAVVAQALGAGLTADWIDRLARRLTTADVRKGGCR